MKRICMRMHIQRINTQIIRRKIDTLKHLAQRQMLPISVHDNLVGAFLHLRFDESEEIFLVHTRGVVDVGVDFKDVVEVAVWY